MNRKNKMIMMKKVVFVINEMATGGVQQSLVNLINEIKNLYDITLVVFFLRDDEKKRIPDGIKVIVLDSPYKHLGMSKEDVKNNPFSFVIHAIWVCLTRIIGRSKVLKLMSPFQKKLKGFDCAISFIHEANQHSLYGGCNEFVLNKIPCNKRITWIHCDFENIGATNKRTEKIYSRFDKIIACSNGCKKAFLHEFPHLKNKCSVIRNCINYNVIREKAGAGYQYDKDYFNIITVARLSEEKGLERSIEAVAYCINQGKKIKYHIVGSGNQKQKLTELTRRLNLLNNIFFYGNQNNPFYYIKNADLFLLSSYHEAAPMVIDESAFLGVPILSTRTTSSDEMLIDNGFGIVCENNSQSLKTTLLDIVQDAQKLETIRASLLSSSFSNDGVKNEVSKII